MKKEHVLEDIHFEEGTIDITDPGYDHDVWCRINKQRIVPGIYRTSVIEDTRNGRIAIARIVLDDQETLDRVNRNRSWRKIGNIGVDAGLAGFFQNKPNFNQKEWLEFCDMLNLQDVTRQNRDQVTGVYYYDDESIKSKGFFTSSGWGDGVYDVYAINKTEKGKRRIVALEIRFL